MAVAARWRALPLADRLAAGIALILAGLAVAVSDPEVGARLFRGVFVQDADEIIRAWYGRCAFENPNIIPFSHLSMPGWTLLLALGEAVARWTGLPLTLMGRLTTVAFAWGALHHAAALLRALGASERRAALGVALIAATPGTFLMALTVYPEIALLALTLAAVRYLAQGRPVAAALAIGPAPLVRWEGALLLALVAAALVVPRWAGAPVATGRRRWAALGLAALPYALYLAVVAARFGNPWLPLAWRTTKAMGAWRLFNPDLTPGALTETLWSLATLYSPLVLVGALPFAAWALRDGPRRVLALAYGGLTVALLSIQHDFMVYPLRVFSGPAALGAVTLLSGRGRLGPALATLGTALALGTGWRYVNDLPLPPPGGAREALGFHSFVRYADAAPVLDAVQALPDGWVVVNHMNANLLRADTTCRLLSRDLRIGGPNLSLSRDYQPSFGLPEGAGYVVFHTLPFGVERCAVIASFDALRQSVYRCGPDAGTGPPPGR